MAPVPETGSVQPPMPSSTAGGHGNHPGGQAVSPAGQTFSSALAQAIDQAPSGGHAGHGASVVTGAGALPHAGSLHAVASNSSGCTHPRHFSVGGARQGENHNFQEKILGLRAYRQQLIASNIANADTPGYKAVDIDLGEAVQELKAGTGKHLQMLATAPGHIEGKGSEMMPGIPLKYHVPYQSAVDGNTVEMDIERQKFSENSLMYQFSLDRVGGHFKHLMEMLQNLK